MVIWKAIILMFFTLFSKSLFSQIIIVEVGNWLGEWETAYIQSGDFGPETVKEDLIIKEIHGRTFVQFSISGGILEDTTLEFKYCTDLFLTLDFEKGKIRGFQIDDHGFNGMMSIKGDVPGNNKITLQGDCPLWTDKTTLELKDDGKLYRNVWRKLRETGAESSIEVIYIRKQ